MIGCGVIGLTCALELQERGHRVRIVAERVPPDTTSDVAAAIWLPYRAEPMHRVARWAAETLRVFEREAADPASGVVLRRGTVEREPGAGPPPWAAALADFGPARADELPARGSAGWSFTAPVVETGRYLPWLRRRFEARGGRLDVCRLGDLDEPRRSAELVVNCTGLGARELAGDAAVFPIRGEVLRVERSGVERFAVDDVTLGAPTYVIPRSADCVLGGTALDGVEDTARDAEACAAIAERCTALVPALAGARALGHAVGLRPGRHAVRVELEPADPARGLRPVIHDYGHGGSGVTLSWGCAREVAGLAARLAR